MYVVSTISIISVAIYSIVATTSNNGKLVHISYIVSCSALVHGILFTNLALFDNFHHLPLIYPYIGLFMTSSLFIQYVFIKQSPIHLLTLLVVTVTSTFASKYSVGIVLH